ncbi:MAG: hypothetical protein J6Y02_10720 [Pseudobutyrivibrio sp.]|nr:hypothetical protein [Pseudobutyrivibrio sp.]
MKTKIGMSDIRHRRDTMSLNYVQPCSNNVSYLYENFNKRYSSNTAKLILKDWQYLENDTNLAFVKVMEVFGEVCCNGTPSEITSMGNMICEDVLHKVRDGSEAEECVHRKIGWVKRKLHEKITNRLDDAKSAFKQVKQNVANGVQDIKDKDKEQIDKVKSAFNPKDKKEKAVKEAFDRILESCVVIEQCDRVLRNHKKLCSRFNIDNIIRESVINEGNLSDCILELCTYIDTYRMPFGVKYNVALENIMYCLDKNAIPYHPSEIANTVTDYFLMNTTVTESVLHDMRYILDRNRFYSKEDLADVQYIYNEQVVAESTEDEIAMLEKAIDPSSKKPKGKELINQFKLLPNKTVEGLRSLVKKMYVKDSDDIIDDTVNLFGLIRAFFIIGATALNPVLGIISLITDFFISMDMNRKDIDRIIVRYEREIYKVDRKLDKAKNENTKERLKKYRDKLKDDLSKLQRHADDLFTDEENEKRSDAAMDREMKRDARANKNKSSNDDDDFNWDISFESAEIEAIAKIDLMDKIVEQLETWEPDLISKQIASHISEISLDDVDNIVSIVSEAPYMFNTQIINTALEVAIMTERKETSYNKYVKINCYQNNMDKLMQPYSFDESALEFNELYDRYSNLDFACEAIKEALEQYNTVLNEASPPTNKTGSNMNSSGGKKKGISAITKLKLAAENFKRGIRKAGDIDRNVSNRIDMSMSNISKNIDRALTSSNREAVIKGTILPSASKVIKAAIVTGAAWLVNPAIAVIGLLGYIGMSIKHRGKERQMIMDEVDVELNMCDRYIHLAEEKNDMKAIRSLLQTKRALEKQRARLKYHAKIELGKPVYSPSTNNNDND